MASSKRKLDKISSYSEPMESEKEFLVPFVWKAKIVKQENGEMLLSMKCPQDYIDVLKKDVIEKPVRAIEEDVKRRKLRDAEFKKLLDDAIAVLKEDRETYIANAKKELCDLMETKLGSLVTSLVNVTTMNSQLFTNVETLHTSVSKLQKDVDEMKTNITNNAMAQQRRHKIFTDYVCKFNDSTMHQLGEISTRQQHFNEECKPSLQDLVNYTNRGVDL